MDSDMEEVRPIEEHKKPDFRTLSGSRLLESSWTYWSSQNQRRPEGPKSDNFVSLRFAKLN